MPKLSLIQKLDKLTSFRDRESMEAYLVELLLDVSSSYLNSLYVVRAITPDPDLRLLARSQQEGITFSNIEGNKLTPEVVKAMGDAIVTGDEQKVVCGDRRVTTFLFPLVSRDLNETIVLVQQSVSPREEQPELVKGLLKIYGNFLELFNDHARDSLTGLLNRVTLNKHLHQIIDLQQRPDKKRRGDKMQHWLGVLDIDHFKQINDRFGHLYGDEILILVSRLMVESFRDNDLCFRYGGEEFIVLLETQSADQALMAFERFRKRVADYLFPQVGKVTISIGIVEVEGHLDISTVIGDADKALYFSKANGRNQCHSFEVLVAAGDVVDERVDTQEVDFF